VTQSLFSTDVRVDIQRVLTVPVGDVAPLEQQEWESECVVAVPVRHQQGVDPSGRDAGDAQLRQQRRRSVDEQTAVDEHQGMHPASGTERVP